MAKKEGLSFKKLEKEEAALIDKNIAARHLGEVPTLNDVVVESKEIEYPLGIKELVDKEFNKGVTVGDFLSDQYNTTVLGSREEGDKLFVKFQTPEGLAVAKADKKRMFDKMQKEQEAKLVKDRKIKMDSRVQEDLEIARLRAEYAEKEKNRKPNLPPIEQDEVLHPPEGTRKEWQGKLRALIEGAKEKTKEKVEWWKSAKEYLIRHSENLDAHLEKIGGTESIFRRLGEKYNKLNWKTKLAVGVGLGVGYGVALSAVSLPAILACIAGIGVQRAAGLATMYLKYENAGPHGGSRAEKFWQWGSREKAMAKALLYTTAMTAGTVYIAKEISESDIANRTKEWLSNMLGHESTPTISVEPDAPEAPPSVSSTAESAQEAVTKALSELKEMPTAPESSGAIPAITVQATHGHGYEYMMKRLWEQLQEHPLDPNAYPKDSDIRQLLEANKDSVDQIVHRIASDPSHRFYNPDGTSVRVLIDSQMTINNEGNVQLGDFVKAPEGAPVTQALPVEATAPTLEHVPPHPDGIVPPDTSPAAVLDKDSAPTPPEETHGRRSLWQWITGKKRS